MRVAPEPRLCRRAPGFDVLSRQGLDRANAARPPFTPPGYRRPTLLWATTPPANACNQPSTHKRCHELANPARSRGNFSAPLTSRHHPPSMTVPPRSPEGDRIGRVKRWQADRVARGPEGPLIAGRTRSGRTPGVTKLGRLPRGLLLRRPDISCRQSRLQSGWIPACTSRPAKSCVTQVFREEPFDVCQPEMPSTLSKMPPPRQEQASRHDVRPKAPPRHACAFFTQL